MDTIIFKGFGGIRLEADVIGKPDDPAILLVHGAGQTRQIWTDVAEGLVSSGRRVVALDMRGHGGSDYVENGQYRFGDFVEDLRAVLAQMGSRPVVVAATAGGWIATAALAEDAANLAAGLVLVDMPAEANQDRVRAETQRLIDQMAAGDDVPPFDMRFLQGLQVDGIDAHLLAAAPKLNLPMLVVRGALSWVQETPANARFDEALPQAEILEVADAELLVATGRTEVFLSHLLDFLDRKQPLSANEFRIGSDARTLRDAMGCFATGITIITATGPDGQPVGMTANSFTSLSLDPPLLLVCVAKTASSAAILENGQYFGVNVLQTGQQSISNKFAGRADERFKDTAWHPGENGVPVLDGSLVSFECRRNAVHDGGDHFILVGEVERAEFEPRRDPLLYFRGKYRRLHFA